MTEKELLYHITSTTIGQLIDLETPNSTSIVEATDNQKNLYQKLIPFLIEQSHLDEIFGTIIEGSAEKFILPNNINDFVKLYDDAYLHPVEINGERILPQTARMLNNTPIMDVKQYEEERLERLLPQMVEAYPLLVIKLLNDKPEFDQPQIVEAIDDYISKYYIQPLRDAVPNADITYKIEDLVHFTVDLSKVKEPHIAAASIPTGNFLTYTITII